MKHFVRIHGLRSLEAALRYVPLSFFGLFAAMGIVSCEEKEQNLLKGNFDPERFATMTTTNVSTLISDSGVVRYKIESPVWYVYDQAKRPRWNFPKGLHLEKYNDMFRVEAEVKCDSAVYFKNEQLWRLDGYVEIVNIAGEKFLTPQLFWDQRHQKLYSDSFIHIERQGRIIEGYGFTSNERMTNYEVLKVMGMFPATDFKPGAASDSTQTPKTPGAGSASSAPKKESGDYRNPVPPKMVAPSNRDDSRSVTPKNPFML